MPGRYAKLKQEWLLRGWTDMPWAAVNWTRSGGWRPLGKNGSYVAEACDGRTDFNTIAFLPDHHAHLDKLIEEGIVEACDEGDSIEPIQTYRRADNPRIFSVHWAITGLCNLDCRHCFMEAPAGRYGELSTAEMMSVLDQFDEANVLDVSLTGGEPFLRKDLLEIIEALAERRICLSQIYTNGLLVTEEALAAIKEIGYKPSFHVSFDGVGGHDRMRGAPGIEPDVIEAIRLIQSAGFWVTIGTSIDRQNLGNMAATYDLIKELGIGQWQIASPMRMGNWRETTTRVSLEEEAEALEPLLERWLAEDKPFAIQLGGFYREAPGRQPEDKPPTKHTAEEYDCGACRERPYLLPDGTLLPCPGYTDSVVQERMPNILHDGLANALRESHLRTVVETKKSEILAHNEECSTCDLFENCGMGCRAIALGETSNLMAKDPISCDLWKKGFVSRFRELAKAGSQAGADPGG